MKRILIVLPYIPYPLTTGGNIAVFEMVNHLRNIHNLTILLPNSNDLNISELRNLWSNVNIETYEIKRSLLQKVKLRLALFFFEQCMTLFYETFQATSSIYRLTNYFFFINVNLVNKLKELVRTHEYDFVQTEFYQNLPLVHFIPKRIPSIFIHHELKFVIEERRNFLSSQNEQDFNFNSLLIGQMKGIELDLLKRYDKIVTVSDIDKGILEDALGQSNIVSSPFTIKMNKLNLASTKVEYIVFLGSSEHSPNLDGVRWFLENCWSDILSIKPNLSFKIVGKWPEKDRSLFRNYRQVEFLGFVDNLKEVFKNCVLIVPIRIGSGMRMKIIDAVNYGIPFLTTSIGVEGLEFADNEDCFIADNDKEFSSKLIQLIDSDSLRIRFCENSKKVLEKKYSYERLTKIRESIYS